MESFNVNSFTLSEHKIGVILLAAGRGARMQADLPKLLLPMHDGKPLLTHAANHALSLQPVEVVVVIRPDLPKLLTALEGLSVRCVPNHRYVEGMGTSIATGVSALGDDVEAVLILLGDEPSISSNIVQKLVEAYVLNRAAITVPVYGEQVGPPAIFSRELFPALAALGGDSGGRQLFARYPEKVCPVLFAQEESPKDIDTQEDYRSALSDPA